MSSRNAHKGWKRPFDDPIPLPRGRQLVTLRDAALYITKLRKAEHDAEEWQALLLVAEHGGPHDARAHRRHEGIEPQLSSSIRTTRTTSRRSAGQSERLAQRPIAGPRGIAHAGPRRTRGIAPTKFERTTGRRRAGVGRMTECLPGELWPSIRSLGHKSDW